MLESFLKSKQKGRNIRSGLSHLKSALSPARLAVRANGVAEVSGGEKSRGGAIPDRGLPVHENTKRPPKGGLFAYDWEDWMKRSFVSCKNDDTKGLLRKTARIVTKVLNLSVTPVPQLLKELPQHRLTLFF